MKSLRWRLACWFSGGVVLVLVMFVAFTYRYLDAELRQKHWQRDYPDHPDWTLHGSYSEGEIRDILDELIETSVIYGIPLCLLALLIGGTLAHKSLKPITHLNRQLQGIRAPTLSDRLKLSEPDPDFQTLVHHINDLLGRLEKSFGDMRDYAAVVAHELRTPLAILRLKVEQAENRIAPDLAEELHSELHQLTHIVGQSLLIAKAEQGRLATHASVFDLTATVQESVTDFSLLAEEQGRSVSFRAPATAPVRADLSHVRQIIHNLLTNALKHGQGTIRVKVLRLDARILLTISNRIRQREGPAPDAFGLGLRVVQTLADLQPDLRCRHRRTAGGYSTRLSLPMAAEGIRTEPARQAPGVGFDAGI
ncbi:MAG: HAMP domain-containing histidine kinase [Verrucomicrobia bacterium]|jgi:signal transduction histidine kinase|nr:HAMP domain-containing histidine kinase [Verrucomicrobiota bacterium]